MNRFLDLLKDKREEIIQNSIELINIPSITSDREKCKEALKFVLDKAYEDGIKISYTKKRDCGVVELGEGEETIGILTHVDVVDVGDINKWQSDPFKGIFDGKFVIGRGAMDDKCPTIIILSILGVLNSLNLKYKKKIQFIIGTSEEELWTDMESYKNEYPIPNYGFTPDGGFPVHNIEKGYGDIELEFEINKNNELTSFSSGNSSNTIPSYGELILDKITDKEKNKLLSLEKMKDIKIAVDKNRVNIESSGKSSHSSLPQNGDNALIKLCKWIKKEKILNDSFNNFLDFIMLMDGDYKGGNLGFDNSVTYKNGDFIGETFINPTLLRLEDNKLKLILNIRHKYGVTKREILDIFHKLKDKYKFNFNLNTDSFLPPLYVDSKNGVFEMMNSAYEEVMGEEGGFALAGGTSYAKSLPNTVSWGPVFPGEKDTCHQENEMMSIDSIMKCAEIYGRFLYKAAVEE